MTRLVSLLLAISASALAGDWTAVSQLAAGTPVEVIHGNLKRASGSIVEANADTVTVDTGGASTVIARADVKRVSVTKRSRRNRALIGMAIGAAAGAAVMAIGAKSGDIDIRYDLLIPAGAVLGAGIGAGVGAMAGGPVTVYRN